MTLTFAARSYYSLATLCGGARDERGLERLITMKRWSERTGLSGGSSLAAHEYALHRATIWVPRRARRRVYTRLRLKISYKSAYFEEIADGETNVRARQRLVVNFFLLICTK